MKPHSIDYASLIFGAFFVLVAGYFLSTGFDPFDIDVRWLGPAALVAIGLAFLAPGRSRRREAATPTEIAATDATSPAVEAAKDELFPSPLD